MTTPPKKPGRNGHLEKPDLSSAAKPPPPPEVIAKARDTAEGVQDEGLRKALETLAQNILTRRKV